MLENLNYIYLSMYALDVYNGILPLLIILTVFIWLVFCIHNIVLLGNNVDKGTVGEAYVDQKRILIKEICAGVFFTLILVFTPSENTLKAYMGVKAAQAVGDYIDKETDIPERSKATITKLWDKVDSYIGTIDIESTVDSTVSKASTVIDSTMSKATR